MVLLYTSGPLYLLIINLWNIAFLQNLSAGVIDFWTLHLPKMLARQLTNHSLYMCSLAGERLRTKKKELVQLGPSLYYLIERSLEYT